MASCEPTLESFIKPRNFNLLVVSGAQSVSTIISAVDNFYPVDPGTVKYPDLTVVQETSHSKESSDEKVLHYFIM